MNSLRAMSMYRRYMDMYNAQEHVDLRSARPGGAEWNAWETELLASPDGKFYYDQFKDYFDTRDQVIDRVLDRACAFCQTCFRQHVPNRRYVVWFDRPYEGFHPRWSGRHSSNSACLECLRCIPPAERPDVAWYA